ncbi:MAG: FtsQ-type POTRA domain-containing protein [Verrucomicrobiales bacterium]|nr:FtsQ-type POTRA domain-containing protein [Verrucomicrobiales bacterium]
MRKKRGISNQRKNHWGGAFRRRHRGVDETEWIMLEADTGASTHIVKKTGHSRARAWAVRGLAIACLSVSIPYGAQWAHNEIFFENEEFVLKRLDFKSDGILTQANLSEISNVSVGMKLLELDLENIRERISKIPVVQEVVVSREMPDRLNINVKERTPVAWISCPPLGVRPGDMERGFLVDDAGYLFRCLDLTEEIEALPIIENFAMAEPIEGLQMSDKGMLGAIDLVLRSPALSEDGSMDVHLVRVRNEWSLQCRYRSGLQTVFSLYELDRGLLDLQLVLKQAEKMGQHLATVDVSASENIPATFAGPIDPERISAVATPVGMTDYSGGDAPVADEENHLRSILNGG